MTEKIFSDEILLEAQKCVREHRILPLYKDIVFKMFLTRDTPESNYCLRKLLGAIIGKEVKKAKVLNPDIQADFISGKSSRLDINVTFDNGNKANIEMQCSKMEDNQLLRAVFYSSRLVSSSIGEGESYGSMKYIHQIMITDFTLFTGKNKKDAFYHRLLLKDEENEVATDRINIHFIELTKLKRIIREKLASPQAIQNLTELEFWSILLKYNDREKIIEKLFKARQFKEEIQMANESAIQISQDEVAWAYHLSCDRAETDYKIEMRLAKAKAQRQGRIEGAREASEQTAIAMLKDSVPVEKAAQYTGLTVERIRELAVKITSV